ncbi:hypothetical protein LtaPh_2110000 [Leishmania tarentolae]|uniref:Uncharacterized protein n=1 Tax=Leishmania tarentolae TaxID=5689 RepID=A0A640KFU7_LEITA|nr:hypothetical protein LtaPh_2110000 [Leishmania tarentolae]
MCDDDCGEAQPLAPQVMEDTVVEAIEDAAHTSRQHVSGSPSEATAESALTFSPPMQEPTPVPTPAARLFTSRLTPNASPLITGTRPARWPSSSPPRSCGSPIVTFAPSTRFDQCRQRTNVAMRRSDDVMHCALQAPFRELPLSSTWASSGQMTDSALRSIGLRQSRIFPRSPPTPSPRQLPLFTLSEGLRDFVADDLSDTASSADSACSTNSSSTTLLGDDIPVVRPRTPPSLALGLSLPSVALLAPSDCTHVTFPSRRDAIDPSAPATVGAVANTTPPSLASRNDVSFALLEPGKLAPRTASYFAETVGSTSEQGHVGHAKKERPGASLAQCRKRVPAARLMIKPCQTSVKTPPPPLIEGFLLSSTPEATPSVAPLLLTPSPLMNSAELANSRIVPRGPDTLSKQLHTASHDEASSRNRVELLVNAVAEETVLWQEKSLTASIRAPSQWSGEEIHESPIITTGAPVDKAAAVTSTTRTAGAFCDRNHRAGTIDVQPSKATTPPHTLFSAASSSDSGVATDRRRRAVGSSGTSSAGTEKVGEDGTAVTMPPPLHPPPHPAELWSPHDEGRCAEDFAADVETVWVQPPGRLPTPSKLCLFQNPLRCSTNLATCSLAMASAAGRFVCSSNGSHAGRGSGAHGGLSQPPLSIDTASNDLRSGCEVPAAISVAVTDDIACVVAHHADRSMVGDAGSPDTTSLAKQPIHSGSDSSRSSSHNNSCNCEVGAGAGALCLASAHKGNAARGSPLPLASPPTPPRSVLAAGYASLLRLSGDQGSSHHLRCSQRHLPRHLLTSLTNDSTIAATSRPPPWSSSSVREQSGGLGASLSSLPTESISAPRRSANASLSGTHLQHASPMFCSSPKASTTTIPTAHPYFSGTERSRSPVCTTRSGTGPVLFSSLPPLHQNAPYGDSAPISPKGAGLADE